MSGELLQAVPSNYNFQDTYDNHNKSGFSAGRDGTSILICSQSGIRTADIADVLDLSPEQITTSRAPASAVLPGSREEAERQLVGQIDAAFTHPGCRGATLLDGKEHPDTRAARAVKTFADKIGAHYGGDLPLRGNRSNVLFVVGSDVEDFEPSLIDAFPDAYTVHAHIGQERALKVNTQVLLDVIGGFFPDSTTHLVGVTNGRRGASGQMSDKLRKIAEGKPNVKISPLVVRRR